MWNTIRMQTRNTRFIMDSIIITDGAKVHINVEYTKILGGNLHFDLCDSRRSDENQPFTRLVVSCRYAFICSELQNAACSPPSDAGY